MEMLQYFYDLKDLSKRKRKSKLAAYVKHITFLNRFYGFSFKGNRNDFEESAANEKRKYAMMPTPLEYEEFIKNIKRGITSLDLSFNYETIQKIGSYLYSIDKSGSLDQYIDYLTKEIHSYRFSRNTEYAIEDNLSIASLIKTRKYYNDFDNLFKRLQEAGLFDLKYLLDNKQYETMIALSSAYPDYKYYFSMINLVRQIESKESAGTIYNTFLNSFRKDFDNLPVECYQSIIDFIRENYQYSLIPSENPELTAEIQKEYIDSIKFKYFQAVPNMSFLKDFDLSVRLDIIKELFLVINLNPKINVEKALEKRMEQLNVSKEEFIEHIKNDEDCIKNEIKRIALINSSDYIDYDVTGDDNFPYSPFLPRVYEQIRSLLVRMFLGTDPDFEESAIVDVNSDLKMVNEVVSEMLSLEYYKNYNRINGGMELLEKKIYLMDIMRIYGMKISLDKLKEIRENSSEDSMLNMARFVDFNNVSKEDIHELFESLTIDGIYHIYDGCVDGSIIRQVDVTDAAVLCHTLIPEEEYIEKNEDELERLLGDINEMTGITAYDIFNADNSTLPILVKQLSEEEIEKAILKALENSALNLSYVEEALINIGAKGLSIELVKRAEITAILQNDNEGIKLCTEYREALSPKPAPLGEKIVQKFKDPAIEV